MPCNRGENKFKRADLMDKILRYFAADVEIEELHFKLIHPALKLVVKHESLATALDLIWYEKKIRSKPSSDFKVSRS